MAGVGGYQRPAQPAAVSGPGAMSQRTDGQPGETATQAARYISGGSYGEGQEMMALQQSGPMAADAGMPLPPSLAEPTERPDEPITYGAPFGAGPNEPPPITGVPPQQDAVADSVRRMYQEYPSAWLRILVQQLDEQGR